MIVERKRRQRRCVKAIAIRSRGVEARERDFW
jgi:hypothetical protein